MLMWMGKHVYIYIPFIIWLPLMQISPAWFRGSEAPVS